VIKIRYAELPTGLHIQTLTQGRDTVLYLLPGLTPGQRRAAIRRAQSNARVGHGPPLPPAGIVLALTLDRIRTTLGNGLGAMRMHPSFLVPTAVVVASVAVAYLLLASVTFELRPPLATGTRPGVAGAALAPVPTPRPHQRATAPAPHGHQPAAPAPGPTGPGGHSPGRHPGPTASPTPSPSTPITPRPISPTSPPVPTPGPTRSSAPTPGPSPGPGPLPRPTPSPAPSGVCARIGPFGVCIRA
jgi:hypothetical protein